MSEFKKAMENYANYVVKEARNNLAKEGKAGGLLDKSLGFEVKQNRGAGGRFATGYNAEFFMEDYGIYQDLGVKGNDPSKVSPYAKRKGQQAPNSPFKFGSGKGKGDFKSFTEKMAEFAKKKNIRFRQGKTGKFAKGGYKSMGYVIASNIYNRGLRPSLFFTKPFEAGIKKYEDDIAGGFGDDILNQL